MDSTAGSYYIPTFLHKKKSSTICISQKKMGVLISHPLERLFLISHPLERLFLSRFLEKREKCLFWFRGRTKGPTV